jgi:polar amino acid transport system substrate-binding protein
MINEVLKVRTGLAKKDPVMKRCAAVWLAGLLLFGAAAPVLAETILEKISRTGVLSAGTRGNAIPFAFINEKNEWIGFSIDLLEAIRLAWRRS